MKQENEKKNANCINQLTSKNKNVVEKSFLEHADTVNYQGLYDFSEEEGLQIEWGKYDYNVPASEQEIDLDMLYKAAKAFNTKHSGVYVAFPDEGDKFNTVTIMDLKQISESGYYLNIIKDSKVPELQLAYGIILKNCI